MNAVKKMLKRRGASIHPWRMPCSTANQPLLMLHVSHISTVLYCIPIAGVEKERRTKTRPMEKPEKAAPVPGTALRTTGPVPVDSRQ